MCFCAILPSHMLNEIAKNGSPDKRAKAIKNLSLMARLHGQRDILGQQPSLMPPGVKYRSVYNAHARQRLPGVLVRREGDGDTGNAAVDEAYSGSGTVYDFYRAVFNRNSLDGRGMRIDSTVHFGNNFENAYFNGNQMVYGDGDGVTFGPFTHQLDVIAHELTHGVVQFSANLTYHGQSGALNESWADVFGSMCKQWALQQTVDQADWLVGAGLLLGKGDQGLRSLANPGTAYDDPLLGKDPQPATMDDYLVMDDDDGGVHINSGIPNKAFYTTAMALGGKSWEKAGAIWYLALLRFLTPTSDFSMAAQATVQAASELYGAGSAERQAVESGWEAVKVSRQPATQVAALISTGSTGNSDV